MSGADRLTWIRYSEVEVGPPPGLAELYTAKKYRTGKYVDGKWSYGLHIEFDIKGGNKSKADDCKILIFNRLKPVENQQIAYYKSEGMPGLMIRENSPVIVRTGYIDSYSTIFEGEVKTISEYRDGLDIITEIRADAKFGRYLDGRVTKKFKGKKYTSIAMWLASASGLSLGYIEDKNLYPPGTFHVTTEKSIRKWIKEITRALNQDGEGWKWYVKQGRFFLLTEKKGFRTGLNLSGATGLISLKPSDEKKKKHQFTMKHTMLYNISKDSIIAIEKKVYKVKEYRFISNDDEHIVEAKLKKIGDLESEPKGEWQVPIDVPEILDRQIEQQLDGIGIGDRFTGKYGEWGP